MFDFLIWSKIVRDSSLSNRPFFTRNYKAQRRVWASHGRLVPSSDLYRKSKLKIKCYQTPGCVTYTLSSRIQLRENFVPSFSRWLTLVEEDANPTPFVRVRQQLGTPTLTGNCPQE